MATHRVAPVRRPNMMTSFLTPKRSEQICEVAYICSAQIDTLHGYSRDLVTRDYADDLSLSRVDEFIVDSKYADTEFWSTAR